MVYGQLINVFGSLKKKMRKNKLYFSLKWTVITFKFNQVYLMSSYIEKSLFIYNILKVMDIFVQYICCVRWLPVKFEEIPDIDKTNQCLSKVHTWLVLK